MRWLMTLLLPIVAVGGARADTFLFVSQRPEKKLQIFRLEPDDGKLTSVETVEVDGEPAASAVDPLKKRLIVSLYNPAARATFAIDQASGKIKPLGKVLLGKGNDAAFVTTDRTGRWVLSAAYGGGKVFVHRLKEDGTLEEKPADMVKTAVTAHAVAMSPDNKWAFVPHVSPNAIYQFKFDADTGKLKEADVAKVDGGYPGAGPRHLAFHPTLPMAFSSDESGMSITSYLFSPTTGLKAAQSVSTVPEKKKGFSTAEVKVHPHGKFVWVSNRGPDSLAGFAIDKEGKLTSIGNTPTEKTPRSFDIDPDGRYIFGAGEGSGKLAVFRVNPDTGELTRIHTYDVGKSLPWVLAVKMPAVRGALPRVESDWRLADDAGNQKSQRGRTVPVLHENEKEAAMAFINISPMIAFLMAITGNSTVDIVSMLPASDYFQSRNIDVTFGKMIELAGKDPVDGKTSLQQLLALRVLGEDAANFKKAPGLAANLKTLEDIAAGKKAEDKLGFSREYAAFALASLTDKKLPERPAGKKLADVALDWFPEDVGLVLALDLSSSQSKLGQTKEIRDMSAALAKKIPADVKADIYNAVEELGNVRVDRIAISVHEKVPNRDTRFYYRFSGKYDHKRLTDLFVKLVPNQQIERMKGPNNEPITILPGARLDPAMAFIGSSDVVLALQEGKDSVTLVKQMFEVRAGQAPSVLKSKLADEIKKVSDRASGLLVGTLLPPELVRELGPPRGPFSSLPSSYLFEAHRQKDGIEFRFQGNLGKNEDAKTFIEDALKVRGQAMIKMKLDMNSPIPFDGILKTLGTLKMEAKEDTVVATMRLTHETIAFYLGVLIKLSDELK